MLSHAIKRAQVLANDPTLAGVPGWFTADQVAGLAGISITATRRALLKLTLAGSLRRQRIPENQAFLYQVIDQANSTSPHHAFTKEAS